VPRPPAAACQRLILAHALALILIVLAARTATAQEKAAETNSLARYAPSGNFFFYLQYDGLDAHSEAWKKTAAYKILNQTPTGAMLEDVAVQLINRLSERFPSGKTPANGADTVAFIKHLARSGFLYAIIDHHDNPLTAPTIFVVRNGFTDKMVREMMRKSFASMNAPNTKPQSVVRGTHKIVSGVDVRGGKFAWWVEESRKEDIILVTPTLEAADFVLDSLDGKKPSAVNDPRIMELSKSSDGFLPHGIAFVDPLLFQKREIWATIGLKSIKSLDFRWGFHENALMTITRISTSGPRQGLLSLFDGATFDKAKLAPIPATVVEFTVVGLDFKILMAKVISLIKSFKPEIEEQVNSVIDSVKTMTKLRLKEDILPQIGPKLAFYIIPTKAGAKAPPALSGMLETITTSLGFGQVPKAALVLDIDDPVAFGKILDQLMVAVNKELKIRAAKTLGVDVTPTKGSRNRAPNVPSATFRLMPGESKLYVLTVPPELSSQFPATFRPAIKLGPKQAVIGVTPEVVRVVLETKGAWTAPAEVSSALQVLSPKLKFLSLSDPSDSLPGLLAGLPGNLQKGLNAALLFSPPAIPPAATPGVGQSAPGAVSPTPGMVLPTPDAVGVAPGRRGSRPGAAAPGASPMAPAAPGGSGASASPPGSIVIQVDPSKLPSADAIKAFLFPSIFAIESNDDEIRIVSRAAFPSIPDLSKLSAIWTLVGPWMGLQGLMPPIPPPSGVAGPGPAAPPQQEGPKVPKPGMVIPNNNSIKPN
jgi:hypothetical protein